MDGSTTYRLKLTSVFSTPSNVYRFQVPRMPMREIFWLAREPPWRPPAWPGVANP